MEENKTADSVHVYDAQRTYTEKVVEELAAVGELVNIEMNETRFFPYQCYSEEKKGKWSVYYSSDGGKTKIFRLDKIPIDTLRVSDELKDKLRALAFKKIQEIRERMSKRQQSE